MATAFAEVERERRGLADAVEVLTGGTRPAERVHEEVVTVMEEAGVDLSGTVPRAITTGELESCEYVATMGCSTLELDADASGVDVREWALTDPDGRPLEDVREIREEVRARVGDLFDEIEREATTSV
jgi:arsenate reductase